ncbi:MAG: LiaF-related protein [Bacilli bacterium]
MLLGGIILIIGLILLLQIIIPGFQVEFKLVWPLVLIIISIYNMIKSKKATIFMVTLLFLGIWFTLINFEILSPTSIKIFWPIVIIIFGIFIIFNSITFKKKEISSTTNKTSNIKIYGVFGKTEEKINNDNFKGANIYTVFGNVKLDLRNVKIKNKSVVINAYSIFGKTKLLLPENYNIILASSTIFGKKNNNKEQFKEGIPVIYIRCISIVGWSELK